MSAPNDQNPSDKDEKMYEIRNSPELGRYLVASRDIEALTVIISEMPLVSGAGDDDQDIAFGEFPMCLGCYCCMDSDPLRRCTKCGWPVCSDKCQQMEEHVLNECALFSSTHIAYPPPHNWPIINKSILVLRCLLLKERDPSFAWTKVLEPLEHHTERRYKKPYCVKGDEMLLNNLSYFLKGPLDEDTDENCDENNLRLSKNEQDLIIRISGVININAFSTTNVKTSNKHFANQQTMIAQCIYPTAVLLAHSCVPNCTWGIGQTPSLDICVRSTMPIRRGETISIAYSSGDTFYGTLQRQIGNEDVAHFTCTCGRCTDPTEFGTFVSALRCPDCLEDYLLPTNPLDPDSRWKCENKNCNEVQSVHKVVLQICEIQNQFESLKMNRLDNREQISQLTKFLEEVSSNLLHPKHYILQEVRMHIVNKQIPFLSQLSQEEIQEVVGHIETLLQTANILAPGFSQMRSILQHFLGRCLLEQLKRESVENREDLCKMIYFLETRAFMFFKCHQSSQSERIARSIQQDLEALQVHC